MPLTASLCSFSHSYLPQDRERKPARGGWNEIQRPILAMSRVTMLSERASCCFVSRAVRRAVLSAVESNLIVALISDAEQAFPWLIFEAHFRASAMVVIFMENHLKRKGPQIEQERRMWQRRPLLGSPKHGTQHRCHLRCLDRLWCQRRSSK